MTAPLPSADEIRAALTPLDFFVRYANGAREGLAYVSDHAERFRETLACLAPIGRGARVLELGAVPYYMTILVERHLGARVDPLSFYEVEQRRETVHEVTNIETGETFRFPYRAVNVERDLFPVAPRHYDLVLCCEILEHLLINPSHMLYESHRALKDGGRLLISTPNVARWANLAAMAEGRNINDHYHGNGIYGRHNREFTRDEVVRLVEACGFEVERAYTTDVYGAAAPAGIGGVRSDSREDTIFVLARARGEARMACPSEFYVLMDEYRNVVRDSITMGVDDVGQLGHGWHDLEGEPEAFRWTSGRAEFFLATRGAAALRVRACCHHPADRLPVAVELAANGRSIARHTISDNEWHDLAFDLRDVPFGGALNGVLTITAPWRPSDSGGADARALGLQVTTIRLE